MRTHKNLWDNFISKENFDRAVCLSLKGKKKTAAMRSFLKDRAGNTEKLRQTLANGEFKTSPYRLKIVHEPKRREILVLPFYPDRIIHHALMNILKPIWDPMFCRDSYACRVGYGVHAASNRAMQFVRRNKYVLQCDIRKFYPSINHEIMLSIIRRHIRDEKLMAVLSNIINSVDGPAGMPIGSFCSQWFGNLYMNELDVFVKQVLCVRDYARYCDDFCLFSDDKRDLGAWLGKIRSFLSEELRLGFSYAEIAQVSAGLDFLGYRHFPRQRLLRKSMLGRFKRRVRALAKMPPWIRKSDPYARGQIAAMHGWSKHAAHNIHLLIVD